MAKKNTSKPSLSNEKSITKVVSQAKEAVTLTESKKSVNDLIRQLFPYLLIMLGSILLYSNTYKHQYALDDEIVICKNEYVLRGIGGMKDIFSKDLFESFYRQMNTTGQLAGGRYRPLAVASFAIEQEFIGIRQDANFENDCWDFNNNKIKDPSEDLNHDGNFNDKDFKSKGFGFRHFNNAIFYGLAVCMLFLFLSSIVFKNNRILSLIICLLFLFHPIHTEVVSNVKSRDEIFSFFFILLSLYLAHVYAVKLNLKYLVLTAVSFFCAMLSKEYGIVLFFLIPLSLHLFDEHGFKPGKYAKLIIGMVIFFGIYYGIRSSIGGGDEANLQEAELMNNPFLLADEGQKIATKLFIYLKYFLLLIFPHPLSSDYGYNSIPYKDFSDYRVWISLLFLVGGFVGFYFFFRKKHWAAFAFAFYLLTMLLVTNFIFNIGATMGERLVFHASLAYCMLIGYFLYWLSERFKIQYLAIILMLPILGMYAMKTYARNYAWENDVTLALTDVEVMPESIALNGNAASRNLDMSEMPVNKSRQKELIHKAIGYAKKSVKLHPGFVNGYLNLGLGYAKLEQFDSAKHVWDIAFKIYPHHPNKPIYFNLLADAYYRKGLDKAKEKLWNEGKVLIQRAVELNDTNARYWYDLGGFAYNGQDYITAKQAWTKAYQLAPNDTLIRNVQSLLK